MDDFDFLFDWLKHEDNLLVSRGNYYIVGESMLFAAAAQLLASKVIPSLIVVCALGVSLSVIWWVTNYRQIIEPLSKLKNK